MALKTKYSPLQHFSMENVLTAFGDQPPRNKLFSVIIIAVIVALILFLPLSLFSGKVSSLHKEITNAQKSYGQVANKLSEYARVKGDLAELDRQFGRSAGPLTGRIDAMAKQAGLTVDQLTEKPAQETDYLEVNSVEMKLSNVSLSQLMEFLYNLENDQSAPMRIRRIQIKPKFNNRQAMDVSCEVATFSLKKET